MSAASLIARLREHGHRVELDGCEIVIRPRPEESILYELRACRDEIVEHLQETPLASAHRYVLWYAAFDPTQSVCIACGIPPSLHGADALEGARIVDDPDDVAPIEATPVFLSVSAQQFLFGHESPT